MVKQTRAEAWAEFHENLPEINAWLKKAMQATQRKKEAKKATSEKK